VPDDPRVLGAVDRTFAAHRLTTHRVGTVVAGEGKHVLLHGRTWSAMATSSDTDSSSGGRGREPERPR
jgi:hypothetical protein